ncbi:MAG TPA: GNAT family N-acetyltransferase [Pyrinomonadaceae bacterium]|nr:GNAT family N-acetyltransferase [Pyrinomonadaceae bacterium]
MKSIRDSVIRASDCTAALSDRHEAFGELVMRFQDMAFAYSFAVLGDAYLAEDVAQEAFITAWHQLHQLREPEAFPGWFKRIVGTQCNRLLRTRRLQFVESESALHTELKDPGPGLSAERRQLIDKVLEAIRELPEKQRLVTMLFYVNGYSQDDIGRFLDVPVSTVNKRLYTARERLKERMVEVVRSDLDQHRPSRNNNFSNEVNARLRPLTENDWPSITRLAFGPSPRDVDGMEVWVARREKFAESTYLRRHYVAEDPKRKQILGYGAIEQTIYLPRYRLFLVAGPSWLRKGVGDLLLDQLFKDLLNANAVTVSCHEHSSRTELISLLLKRGFEEVNRQLDSRLKLADVSKTSSTERLLEKTGITISSLTEERATDPDCVEKLHRLSATLIEENAELGFKPPAYYAREALMWLEMPYVLPDGYFIAKHGNRYVGVVEVNLHDCPLHGVTLNGPGVLTQYRRQGIAGALMSRAIAYAKTSGFIVMRTFNQPSEKSLLQLIRRMGFKTELEMVTLEKLLRPIIKIANPTLYDDYSGSYVVESPQGPVNIEVRKENEHLTLECIGQKVELFPTSETKFFIKMFYGEISFMRTAEGCVSHLEYSYDDGKRFEHYRATKTAEIKN